MIGLPSRAERDYLGGFGIAAIRIDPVGQASIASPVQVSRVPAAAVLWARDRCAANEIVTALGDYRATGVDNAIREVEAAALRLGVVLSPHAVVMRRAKAATAEITTRISSAGTYWNGCPAASQRIWTPYHRVAAWWRSAWPGNAAWVERVDAPRPGLLAIEVQRPFNFVAAKP
jgi:hypothetical protein